VAIRTVLIDKRAGTAEYGVGGGITWDSVPENELEECRTKARVLTKRQPEFDLLETMLWTPEGGVLFLEEHLRRLLDSADFFSINVNPQEVRRCLVESVEALSGCPARRLRLRVSGKGNVVVDSHDLGPSPQAYRLRLAEAPVDSGNVFLYHKTTFREVYDRALSGRGNADDVLLWNERRELTESTIGNLVVEMDGRLLTPPVERGLLGGIYRNWVLHQNRGQEKLMQGEALGGCTRLYLVTSVRGVGEAALI
jgi:para-aminobenzoate synthetase / 4-amino-4-deoxychorismate lyase